MYPFLNTDSTPSSSSSSLSSLAAASQDRVWVSLRNPYEDLHRGDVVVFWSPRNPEHKAVKRVVGLEGDIVEMREGSGLRATGRGKLGFEGRGGKEVTVPVGHIWVEGEHPEGARWSLDSNTYGPVGLLHFQLPTRLLAVLLTREIDPYRATSRQSQSGVLAMGESRVGAMAGLEG